MSVSSLVKIWAVLLVLLALSIALGFLKNHVLGTVLVFGVATIKAYLVLMYYMGLKWEPKAITWILVTGVLFMFVLFFYLVPDIIYVYGRI